MTPEDQQIYDILNRTIFRNKDFDITNDHGKYANIIMLSDKHKI